jgi:hypothetical protein
VLVPSRATSRWVEQFGRTVVEAQACGAVVAGYASGTIPEVAAGGAWLAAEADTLGLARAAARLAVDEAAWRALRGRGAAAAADKGWSAVAAGQLELYRRAVAAGPQQPGPANARSRAEASARFGPPARTGDGQARPFALPVLRDRRRLGSTLGRMLDLGSSAKTQG